MNIYTTRSINIISLTVTIIVFLILNILINPFFNNNSKPNSLSEQFNQNQKDGNIVNSNILEENQENSQEYNWYIEIKSISLKAPIEETIQNNILSKAVGHFEETSLQEGNIGLAAHNRGYEINYFENLKNVQMEDEIEYHYNEFSKTYVVDTIEIIQDTDWSYLEKTEKNKITLITCVENEPKLRRCVQATEKE